MVTRQAKYAKHKYHSDKASQFSGLDTRLQCLSNRTKAIIVAEYGIDINIDDLRDRVQYSNDFAKCPNVGNKILNEVMQLLESI